MHLERLVDFFQTLTPVSVQRFAEFYDRDAWFMDPFNTATGVRNIQRIFEHMFHQVDEPRFVVTEQMSDGENAMLIWDFHFYSNLFGQQRRQTIRGATHLRFNKEGQVIYHRDYWDAASEVYMGIPVLGWVLRRVRRAFSRG
jgi:steroid delta-isomerase